MVVAKGEACCTLYKTQGKVCNDELYAIEGTSLELWHKRLGHMSKKGLQVLVRKSLIPLAKNESLSSCDHCLVRKQHRVSFSSRSKKSKKLELEYFDVCGPIDMEILEETGTLSLSLMMLPRRYGFICFDQKIKSFSIFHSFMS